MKKVKYPNLNDYDLSDYIELKGDILYKINGGAQVENSNEGVANAQVGDTITRNDGTTVTLNAGDIKYAQNHLGNNGGGSSGGSATGNIGDISGGNASASMGTSAPAAGAQSMGNPSGSNAPSSAGVVETGSSLKDSSLVSSSDQDAMTRSDIQISLTNGLKVRLDINQVNKNVIKGSAAIGNAVDKLMWEKEVEKHPNGWAAGTAFDSKEKAAHAWAITYADDSICSMREYGSTIYSFEVEEIKDGKKQVVTKYSYNIPNISNNNDIKRVSINENLLPGQKAVAAIHSHGDFDRGYNDETPSSDDRTGVKEKGYVCEFLLTPLGKLYSYDGTGIISTVASNLLRDPWADRPYDNFTRDYDRMYENWHPDPYIDNYGRIKNLY